MTTYLVSLTKEAFNAVWDAMPPACRFTDPDSQEWPSPNFWLYDAEGKVVVFTCQPIERLSSVKIILNDGKF